MLRVRALIVVPLALLLAAVAVRAMVFEAPGDHPLHALRPTFAGHPAALIDGAMGDIGAAARAGRAIPTAATGEILAAARKAPLAPEPFLVEGTAAQMNGDAARAERLFLAARYRDPRAPAARYFLADRYFHTGRIAEGLREMSVLARLSERASQPFAPALAAYARSPGAVAQLRQFFRTAPETRDITLDLLSKDPANAGIVLALAPPLPLRQPVPPQWAANIVAALVTAGDDAGAERIWQRINGIRDRGLLYDPEFRDRSSSPPFAWAMTPGSGGVAEASGSGGLDVIYYGREEVSLATQMLRLSAGSYRLAMRIDAPTGSGGLAWSVRCAAGADRRLLDLPLDRSSKGVVAGEFAVPAACPVQWIELLGHPGDVETTTELRIAALTIQPTGAGR